MNIPLLFSSGSLASATSTAIAISPAAASALAFTSQPGNATAGSAFGTQPVIKTQDPFGNNSTAGLPASLNVTLSLSSGAGPMQGTASMDIGTGAGNGTVSFTDLRIDPAGTNKQLTAGASGLGNVASSVFTVNAGPPSRLIVQPPLASTSTAGTPFIHHPTIRIDAV